MNPLTFFTKCHNARPAIQQKNATRNPQRNARKRLNPQRASGTLCSPLGPFWLTLDAFGLHFGSFWLYPKLFVKFRTLLLNYVRFWIDLRWKNMYWTKERQNVTTTRPRNDERQKGRRKTEKLSHVRSPHGSTITFERLLMKCVLY